MTLPTKQLSRLRLRSQLRRGAAVALAVSPLLLTPAVSPAATSVWNGNTTGTWSATGSWSSGGVPVSNAATDVEFGGDASYIANQNISGNFSLNSLTFYNTNSAATVTIGNTANTIIPVADGSVLPSIVQNGASAVLFNKPVNFNVNGGTITGAGTGDVTITTLPQGTGNNIEIIASGNFNVTLTTYTKTNGDKIWTNNLADGKELRFGTINLGNTNNNKSVTFGGSGTTRITGNITTTDATTAPDLVKTGTGTLILAGNNSYNGTTTVTSGVLSVSNVADGGNLGIGTSRIVLGDAATEGVLRYTGNTATFARGFTVSAAGGRIDVTTAGQTLGLDTVATSGSGPFRKGGAGTLSLNVNNTISGPITVLEGTLVKGSTGALGTSSVFTIAPGAAIDSGAFGLSVSTGGSLTAGRSSAFANDLIGDLSLATDSTLTVAGVGSPGTFTHSGNLSLAADATVRFDLNNITTAGNGVNDLVAVSGDLVLPTEADTVKVALTALNGPLASGSYTLFTYGGTLTGTAANLAAPTGVAAGRSTFSYDTNTPGSVLLVVTGDAASLTWTGNSDTNAWDHTTADVFSGPADPKFYDGDAVNFTDTGAANGTVNLSGDLQPITVNVNSASNYVFAGTGAITGGGSVNKNGTGSLTIQTANSYAGATTVNAGVLVVAHNDALGSPLGATTVASGAQVQLSGGVNTPESFTVSGTGVANTGVIHNAAGANTVSGTVTLADHALIVNADTSNALTFAAASAFTGTDKNLTFDGAGNTIVNGAISLAAGTLTKNGTGKLTLGGSTANTGGQVTVNGGELELGKTSGNAISAALVIGNSTDPATVRLLNANQIVNGGSVTVNALATLDLNGKNDTIGNLSGSGLVTSATPTTLDITTASFGGLITGALGITKSNTGTVSITGVANTFTGGLTLNNGTFEVSSLGDSGPGSNGTGAIRLINNANTATLRYIGGNNVTLTRPLELFGTTTGGVAVIENNGSGTISLGNASVTSAVSHTLTLSGNNTGDNVVAGVISNGTGTLNLNKAGTGTWVLANDNTFAGNVIVNNGVLKVTRTGALGTGTKTVSVANNTKPQLHIDGSAGNITFPAGITFTASSDVLGIVNVAGDNVINGVVTLVSEGGGHGRVTAAGGTLTLAGGVNATTTNRTLLIGGAAQGFITGNVVNGTQTVSVSKDGPGTWTLAGESNTYTGATTVQAGKLLINGTLASGTAAVIVQGGATLGGSGTINRPVTIQSGGSLSPGNSAGALSIAGPLSLDGGTLAIELAGNTAGTEYDQVVVGSADDTNNVTIAEGVALAVTTSFVPAEGDTFWIVNNLGTGTTTGVFSVDGTPVLEGELFTVSGRQFAIHYGADISTVSLSGGNDIALVAQPIPEPSAVAIAAMASIGLLSSRRRRSSR